MIREEGVPPDAGVEKCRKILALLVRAGFVLGPVNPSRFPCWSTRLAALAAKHINHIIFRARHLRLGEEGKQVLVFAVPVHYDDFLAAVARHLIRGFLEQLQLQFHAVRYGARLVLRFKNLPEVIFGKNQGKFLLRRVQSRLANIQKIRSQRPMRPMLFQNAEKQQTCSFRLPNRGAEIFRRRRFSLRGKLRLATCRNQSKQKEESQGHSFFHKPSRTTTRAILLPTS